MASGAFQEIWGFSSMLQKLSGVFSRVLISSGVPRGFRSVLGIFKKFKIVPGYLMDL